MDCAQGGQLIRGGVQGQVHLQGQNFEERGEVDRFGGTALPGHKNSSYERVQNIIQEHLAGRSGLRINRKCFRNRLLSAAGHQPAQNNIPGRLNIFIFLSTSHPWLADRVDVLYKVWRK